MFKREEARAAMEEMWGEKLKWVSKVMPRILGVFARGKGMLLMEMLGWRLDWWWSGVKRVMEDLLGAMERPLEVAQSEMEERWALIRDSDWGMEQEEWREERSSA
jgi:hypothetical protein